MLIVIQFTSEIVKNAYCYRLITNNFDVVEYQEFDKNAIKVKVSNYVKGDVFSYISNENSSMFSIYNNEIEYLSITKDV